MQGLKELLRRSREHCTLEKQLASQKRKTMLQVYFRKWKDRQCHMTNLHITAVKVKGQLEGRSLSYAFLTWRLLCRERRTEHSYNHRLLLQTWQTWRRSLANHQKAAIMRRDGEKSLLMQSFHALHTWARDRSGRRIILHCVQTRKNHFTLKMTFAMWLDECRLRRSARGHHNMHIQRKVLIAWRGLIQKQKDLTALHQMVTSQVNDRREREAFRVWKDSYCASRQAEAKLVAFFKRKEASILDKCFRDWRDHVLEVQAQNLRERRLMRWAVDSWRRSVEGKKLIRQYESELEELAVLHRDHSVRQGYFNKWRSAYEACRQQRRRCFLEQKYGLLWKQRVTQALMAQAMARYGRLERCWKAWRKNFIIDRISKDSLEQDQCILLKKVFHRWHQVSVLQ
ncbi:protein SFI1 homolog [Lytechinus variegatus]|uniref:protein SFI1 homolog n=1 Tax=Lytechinus variegatus TaxID=7654 RepID=UPI001BB189C6|nr:protein SFI1 homolog [Lytechinus variegatus]